MHAYSSDGGIDPQLTNRIVDDLQARGYSQIDLPASYQPDDGDVEWVRECGRRAGRKMGTRIRTFRHDYDDGSVRVVVGDLAVEDQVRERA